MNRARVYVCLIGSALLAAAALAQDDLPDWPEREIEFEILDEPLELTDFTARPGQVWPRFAVSYTADAMHGFLRWSREDQKKTFQQVQTERLLNTSLAKNLSERQREFVQSSAWVRTRSARRGTLDGYSGSATRCTLYAVTEQDARLLAEATLEMHDAGRRARFEKTKANALKQRTTLAELQEQLQTAEHEVPETEQTLQSARKAAPHKSREAAEEDIDRLDVSLWSIEVGIAGINAKTAAIQQLKAEKDGTQDSDTLQVLDRLLMEQDVELAGLLAQKDMVKGRLNLAKAYVTAASKYDQAVDRVEKLRDNIESTEASLEQSEKSLRTPGDSIRPVRVFGSIVIQPIQYPGE